LLLPQPLFAGRLPDVLVKIEKMPKLQTACTTVISEGMMVTSDSEEVKQARKSMVECCWEITRWIVRYAMRAASANCRT